MTKRLPSRILALTVAGALALAACGRSDDAAGDEDTTPSVPPGIVHPIGADDIVLRIGFEGGYVPAGYAFMNLPTVLVTGDGRLITQGAQILIYPGPLLPPLFVQSITEAGIQELLALADQAGLLATPPEYARDEFLADAPDTVVWISAKGETFEHRAYGLGFDDETDPARKALADYIAAVQAWIGQAGDALGEPEPYTSASFLIQAMETDLSGYTDQDLEPKVVEWPAEFPVRLADATVCAEVPTDLAQELFESADQLTFFQEAGADAPVYSLSAKPKLPGDSC
jgi:hypothetical protein